MRHTRYLDAISASGIVTHLGVFKPKDIRNHSPTCDVHLRRHEEKETDVAIASAIVEAAAARECSAIALVSGDTDLVPALQTARRIHSGLKRYCFFPRIDRTGRSTRARTAASRSPPRSCPATGCQTRSSTPSEGRSRSLWAGRRQTTQPKREQKPPEGGFAPRAHVRGQKRSGTATRYPTTASGDARRRAGDATTDPCVHPDGSAIAW